eukprot:gb/GECG01016118.1/.p1 GENE.gb/GECG01016118.1/~~gb/GECG01016118.1/.p1  ORF type:complete len:1684 (+),score=195.70 gb/GECG01016118.1/:1-5052(+)
MRNLETLEHRRSCIGHSAHGADPIVAIAADTSGRTVSDVAPEIKQVAGTAASSLVYALTREGTVVCVDEVSQGRSDKDNVAITNGEGDGAFKQSSHVVWSIQLPVATKEEMEDDAPASEWFHATFLAEFDSLFLANHDGRLLMLDVLSRETSDVGTIEGGVLAADWTADQEMVALANANGNLLVLTAHWEVLAEVPYEPPESSSPTHLCWRHDNQYLALSTCDASTSQRTLRVWTQDLTLHGVGRHEDNTNVADLQASLHWNPNGSLIAMPQVKRDVLQIVFFERNGLRHREFVLPWVDPPIQYVSSLCWNVGADLLAVCLTDRHQPYGTSALQLWYRENYHWYLKQHIEFHSQNCHLEEISSIEWDPENAYTLRVATTDRSTLSRSLHLMHFDWSYCISKGPKCNSAVIDGKALKLTSFKHAIVAPPESYATLEFSSTLYSACFEPTSMHHKMLGSDDFLAVTGDNRIAVLTCSGYLCVCVSGLNSPRSRQARSGKLVVAVQDEQGDFWCEGGVPSYFDEDSSLPWGGQLKVNVAELMGYSLSCIRCLRWVSADVAYAAGQLVANYCFVFVAEEDDSYSHKDILVLLSLSKPQSGELTSTVRKFPIRQGRVLQVCRDELVRDFVLFQLSDGSVFELATRDGSVSFRTKIPEASTKMLLLPPKVPVNDVEEQHGDADIQERESVDTDEAATGSRSESYSLHSHLTATFPSSFLVSLSSSSGNLYLEDRLICPACSSIDTHWSLSRCMDASREWKDYVSTRLVYSTLGPIPDLCFASRETLEALTSVDQKGEHNAKLFENNAFDRKGIRPLERGARIVSAIPWEAEVVLQMPRGNLEGIFPRTLVLANTRYFLDTQQYRHAVEVMRRHRIDLNLLVDHDPFSFKKCAETMVGQIRHHDRWDLFLSALENEDVTKTRYPPPPASTRSISASQTIISTNEESQGPWENVSKKDEVCRIFRYAVLQRYPVISPLLTGEEFSKYEYAEDPPWNLVYSLLTSYCKQSTPEVDKALQLIQRVADMESSERKPLLYESLSKHLSADKLLDHLLLLVDSDLLYEESLCTYDLNLVVLVTQKSQKDPKEYLPFLRQLQQLEKRNPLYRNIAIDVYLKRWVEAAEHLFQVYQAQEMSEDEEDIAKNGSTWTGITAESNIEMLIGEPLRACYAILVQYECFETGRTLLFGSCGILCQHLSAEWGKWLGERGSKLIQECRSEALKQQKNPSIQHCLSIEDSRVERARKLRQWSVACLTALDPPQLEEAVAVCAQYPHLTPGWKAASAIMHRTDYCSTEKINAAWAMATDLRKSSSRENWKGAAQLLCDFCNDVESAVLVLCGLENVSMDAEVSGTTNGLYEDAVALARVHKRDDLVETVIVQAISGAAQHLCDSFTERIQTFEKAYAKLEENRDMRMNMPIHELLGVTETQLEERLKEEDQDDGGSVWSDTTSVAGSVASGGSEESAGSRFTDLSKLSGSSLGSATSSNTRKTDGRFSGISSLDLSTNPFSNSGHELDSQERELHRREKKREQKKKKKSSREKRIGRPGSSREQGYYEEHLSRSLPSDDEIREWENFCVTLATLGQIKQAERVRSRYCDMVKRMIRYGELPPRVRFPPKPENATNKVIMVAPYPGAASKPVPENLLPDPETTQNQDAHPDDRYAWVDNRLETLRRKEIDDFMKPLADVSGTSLRNS